MHQKNYILINDALQNQSINKYFLDIVSWADYYAYGRSISTRSYNKQTYRYGFNGMESDNEIAGDKNVYTAPFWQYDSRIGRRWNVDPKPNPSISQYNCFAGNPIWYSDVLGDTIRINYSVGENRQLKQLTYTPGMEYAGDNDFLTKTVTALNGVNEGCVGGGMIGELHSTEKDITIMHHIENCAEGLDIGFNPDAIYKGLNQEGETTAPNYISLGHELAHTWDELNGTIDKTPWLSTKIRQAEKFATHIENQLRAEHDLPLRTHYGLNKNVDGSFSGFGRIIKGNESLFYHTKMTIELLDAGLIYDGRKNNSIELIQPFRYK